MHIIFVPHTHWDREWYNPLDLFRMDLSLLLESLLDILEGDPRYSCFVLDGQTVALEDYLEWFPGNRDRILSMVSAKRLRLGPWYTQPDEFLVSGESLVRNLLVGKSLGESFGDWMPVGYCPDTFGHVGQLPQIFRGFQIDHALFTRGMGDETRSTEYWWASPDGSTILATCLLHAYSIAGRLPEETEKALERVHHEVERLAPYASTQYILLNQGGDHYTPQPFLTRITEELSKEGAYEGVTIGDFQLYSSLVHRENLDHLPSLRGTLRGSRNYPVLPGVLSAHRDIKLRNEEVEIILLRWVEPLGAVNGLRGHGAPRVFLRQAWKYLLQNHAHDTICGCSAEPVTGETLLRFDKAQQIGNRLKHEALRLFAEALTVNGLPDEEAAPLLLVNPLPHGRTEVAEYTVTEPASAPRRAFRAVGAGGEEIPLQVLEVTEREGSHPHPSGERLRDTKLLFMAEHVPSLGASLVYLLKEGEQETAPAGESSTKEGCTLSDPGGEPCLCISNEFFQVTLEGKGTFCLADLITGEKYLNLGFLEVEGDGGDTYNFSPVKGDSPLHHPLANLSGAKKHSGPLCQELCIHGELMLPGGLAQDRLSRSAESVNCPLEMRLQLYQGVPRVHISLEVDNRARDHRLRMAFPLDTRALAAVTDEAFDLVEIPGTPAGEDWIEKPCGTWPMGSFAALMGGERGLAVLARGTRELEIRRGEEETTLLLTLLRCTGWLSREGNLFRRPEAGPKLPTPSAQMQGSQRFQLSLITCPGRETHRLFHQAMAFQAPLEVVPATCRKGMYHPGEALLSLLSRELVFSALKESEKGGTLILRVFNPAGEPHPFSLVTRLPLRGYRPVNLAEEPLGEELPLTASIPVTPHGILTVELIPR